MATGSGLASKLRAAAATRVPAKWQGKLYRAVPDAVLGSIETKSRFGDIDFAKLKDMEIEPPHVPELRSPTDMSYFDDPTVEPAFLNEPEYDYSANAWDIDF